MIARRQELAPETWRTIMKIEVLGDGCTKCRALKKRVEQAVKDLELDAEVSAVMDPEKLAELKAMSLPQLVVDGRMIPAGSLNSLNDIKNFLLAQEGPD